MGDLNIMFEPHDSELIKVGDVLRVLNEARATWVDMEGFRKEVIGRFEDAGFKVAVRCYDTNQPDMYAFDIDLIDRLEGHFDPDRQVHEVTNDLAGLGTGGVIKTKGDLSLLQGGHGHSHGDHHPSHQ